MFRNKLTYYHGTTESRWENIQQEGLFKPNDKKPIGGYWITRGAYFVCENPYIALWYAHFNSCFSENKNDEPVLLSFKYEANKHNEGNVINLLTADGHKLLTYAHNKFRDVIPKNEANDVNLDSKVLELLLKKSKTAKAIIASFQEGSSFQKLIHESNYINPHVLSQNGICPGDHAEICFYPNLGISEVENLSSEDINELTSVGNGDFDLWPLVCKSLNSVLNGKNKQDEFNRYLSNRYPHFSV